MAGGRWRRSTCPGMAGQLSYALILETSSQGMHGVPPPCQLGRGRGAAACVIFLRLPASFMMSIGPRPWGRSLRDARWLCLSLSVGAAPCPNLFGPRPSGPEATQRAAGRRRSWLSMAVHRPVRHDSGPVGRLRHAAWGVTTPPACRMLPSMTPTRAWMPTALQRHTLEPPAMHMASICHPGQPCI